MAWRCAASNSLDHYLKLCLLGPEVPVQDGASVMERVRSILAPLANCSVFCDFNSPARQLVSEQHLPHGANTSATHAHTHARTQACALEAETTRSLSVFTFCVCHLVL